MGRAQLTLMDSVSKQMPSEAMSVTVAGPVWVQVNVDVGAPVFVTVPTLASHRYVMGAGPSASWAAPFRRMLRPRLTWARSAVSESMTGQ